MNDEEKFSDMLQKAVRGDKESIEKIIDLYSPLIERCSYINGRPDEDLKQYLLLKIYLNIGKFHSD